MPAAIRIYENGGPEVLRLEEVEPGKPAAGEVQIRHTAIGVNYIDVYDRTGLYPVKLPSGLGREAAGVVTALGRGVRGLRVGERVAYVFPSPGAYCELRNVPAERVVRVPRGISDEQAAALMLKGMTACYLLHRTHQVRAGETVLVHAAAGGMGLLLTQLASRMGVRVLATVSTSEKAELARAAGAAEVFDYDDVAAKVRAATGGEGVAAVYDGVGRTTFDASLASLRPHGVLVSYGSASGPVAPLDIGRLAPAGSLYVTRPTLQTFIATPAELARRASDVLGWVADGVIDIRVGGRYPLADARRAHEDLEGRRTTGKLLLIP